jgi:hypothetical protein
MSRHGLEPHNGYAVISSRQSNGPFGRAKENGREEPRGKENDRS